MKFCILIIAVLFCSNVSYAKDDLDGTPLASCPGYVPNNLVTSQVGWAIGCFLKAIETKDKALALAISPRSKCLPTDPDHCVDGLMDEEAVDIFFGPLNGHSYYDLVTAAEIVQVNTYVHDGSIEAVFSLAPEKGNVKVAEAWAKDYFDCDFVFERKRGIWLLDECQADIDDIEDGDDAPHIDLSGADSDLPPMLWKPKNNGAK